MAYTNNNKGLRINEQIRVREIRLIDDEGNQKGIVPTIDALRMARDEDLDLVEVSPNANPPVCKILDFGKYRFEMEKKLRNSKKNQKVLWEAGSATPDIFHCDALAKLYDVSIDNLLHFDRAQSEVPIPPAGKHALGVVRLDDEGRVEIPHRAREILQWTSRTERSRSEERRVGKECRSRWSPYH